MKEKYIRDAIVFQNHFWNFYYEQNKEVQDKMDWVIGLVRSLPIIPVKFFKSLKGTDGLFEIRVNAEGNIFRIFCCFDKGNLVILFNGFQKKSNKTPRQEIEKAEKIMKQYFQSKMI